MTKGSTPDTHYSYYSSGRWLEGSTCVPAEMPLDIFVNGVELATILCTPTKLNYLVLGFLYSEGVIEGKDEVTSMRVCEEDSLADVKLARQDFPLPQRRTLGSGCGGGVSFAHEVLNRVDSDIKVAPDDVLLLVKRLNERAELYRECGGVHTAALADAGDLIVVAEDIGRHNTLDKILGECLYSEIETGGRLLIATGRISSEMLSKAARMEVPLVVSRSSPTDRAVALARDAGITLIGYARGNRLSVYSHGERLLRNSKAPVVN